MKLPATSGRLWSWAVCLSSSPTIGGFLVFRRCSSIMKWFDGGSYVHWSPTASPRPLTCFASSPKIHGRNRLTPNAIGTTSRPSTFCWPIISPATSYQLLTKRVHPIRHRSVNCHGLTACQEQTESKFWDAANIWSEFTSVHLTIRTQTDKSVLLPLNILAEITYMRFLL